MSSEWKDALQKLLDENYAAYIDSLQEKSTAELIDMAPEITAAKQVHAELLDCCDEDDMKFLLRFDNPLEVVRGYWESVISSDNHTTEMGYMLWDIQDKGLYSEEQLAKPQRVSGEMPSPATQSKNLIRRRENPMRDEPRSSAAREITTDDLRKMEGKEGLVLQGCGGDPQEWVDGINELFTKAGILLNGSVFQAENVSVFRHGELTNMLFPFDGVELAVGKLSMWRLQTHDQFGGTWLSDYVPNTLGGFAHEQEAPQKPQMQLIGEDGNIFGILGRASRLLKRAGQHEQAKEMSKRVYDSASYNEALHIISEYVETELSPHSNPKKSQKKGKNAHER